MLSKLRKKDKGFTLIELMIVIAIIGILAAIAIPQFTAYRLRGFNATAKSDAKNAYTASQAFFSDTPAGTLSAGTVTSAHELGQYGFRPSANNTVTVGTGTMAGLTLGSVYSVAGATPYSVDAGGNITP